MLGQIRGGPSHHLEKPDFPLPKLAFINAMLAMN
jgi:hypothetical protein